MIEAGSETIGLLTPGGEAAFRLRSLLAHGARRRVRHVEFAALAVVGWQARLKRVEDVSVATLLLILFWPLMLAVAVWVRRDTQGPVFFRQRRIGLGGAEFPMLKFRTMQHITASAGALRQATRSDPRVTRAGAFLRRTSFDELPQLFNVLRGEMSLVGPRPHAPGTCAAGRPFEAVAQGYAARHCVRPGMTGLAQIRGWRGETDTVDKLLRRVEADLEYIEHWSIWLDVAVLARTTRAVLTMRNAY